jgi:hypothetical protein
MAPSCQECDQSMDRSSLDICVFMDPLIHDYEQRAVHSMVDAYSWQFSLVANSLNSKFATLHSIMSANQYHRRSFKGAPSHHKVHNFCNTPADILGPVLDALAQSRTQIQSLLEMQG